MLNIIALLSLAQASFAYVIINDCPTAPINVYDVAHKKEIHPNSNPKKCLDVRNGVFANGTPVQIYDCNGTPAQHWYIHPGSTIVQLAGTNFCLDAGATPANGVPLKIWQCYNKLPAQQWFYTGDHRIALEGKGFCADLRGGVLTNGNPVQTWTCVDKNTNQIWTTTPALLESLEAPQWQEILD